MNSTKYMELVFPFECLHTLVGILFKATSLDYDINLIWRLIRYMMSLGLSLRMAWKVICFGANILTPACNMLLWIYDFKLSRTTTKFYPLVMRKLFFLVILCPKCFLLQMKTYESWSRFFAKIYKGNEKIIKH